MANSAEDFLAHYGVPGMKWGRRKIGETRESRRAANRETLKRFGENRLAENNGSRGKAIAKSVGKMAGVNIASNILVGALPNGPVKIGAAAAATLLQIGSMGKGINEIRAINEATRD